MNAAHLHLLVNHLPIFGFIVSSLLLLFALILRNETLARTGMIGAVLSAIAGFVAIQSGGGAEDIVEKIAGVTEHAIEEHEESAELAAIIGYVAGLIGLLGLFLGRRAARIRLWTLLALIACLATSGFMAYTGNLGGLVRHQEIKDGAAAAGAPATNAPESAEQGEDRD